MLNTDDNYLRSLGLSGFGGTVRYGDGVWILEYAGNSGAIDSLYMLSC